MPMPFIKVSLAGGRTSHACWPLSPSQGSGAGRIPPFMRIVFGAAGLLRKRLVFLDLKSEQSHFIARRHPKGSSDESAGGYTIGPTGYAAGQFHHEPSRGIHKSGVEDDGP